MIDKIIDITAGINIAIDENKARQFEKYMQLLIEWNEKMNLTAITEPDEIIVKHFADSITPLCFYDFTDKSVIDVGTGAGFPGLPLKIAQPKIKLTLVDALQKRVGFLQTVCDELGLDEVECIHARAEELSRENGFRDSFDIAVSRAVAPLNILCEYDLPYVKVGGSLIALKGRLATEEIREAQNAVKVLGAEVEEIKEIKLPESDIVHSLVKLTKLQPTDEKYPRRAKKISSKPL